MKTASLPAVRIAPELRERAQSQLREGESLSSFVEEPVRLNVLRREADREFVEHDLASHKCACETNRYHSVAKVVGELRADLAAVRKRRAKTVTA